MPWKWMQCNETYSSSEEEEEEEEEEDDEEEDEAEDFLDLLDNFNIKNINRVFDTMEIQQRQTS